MHNWRAELTTFSTGKTSFSLKFLSGNFMDNSASRLYSRNMKNKRNKVCLPSAKAHASINKTDCLARRGA